jgi:hypothetical protein
LRALAGTAAQSIPEPTIDGGHEELMGHVVLLGDSIFDNASYVRGGPDVVAQLRDVLPAGWRADLLAVDGAIITDVPRQLARAPSSATHLVLSVGGNDALGHASLLGRPARDATEVLCWFAEATSDFRLRYRALLSHIAGEVRPGQRISVCTIYNGNLGAEMHAAVSAALAIFNDSISRAARERGWNVIELRDLCCEPADYANPIEPSVIGGAKIAAAIMREVTAG